jgi:hypothetical protein
VRRRVCVAENEKKMNDDEHFIENAPFRSGDTSERCVI